MSIYYNYILYQPVPSTLTSSSSNFSSNFSSNSSSSTYNGYTTNIERRLRQHNGELRGGAKATTRKIRRGGMWRFLAIVTCPSWTSTDALKFEWNLRYPTRKKPRPSVYQGRQGRIQGLLFILLHSKHPDDLFVHVHQDFLEECVRTLSTLPNVHVYPLEPFLQTQTQTQTQMSDMPSSQSDHNFISQS